jgi:hypothetical protein
MSLATTNVSAYRYVQRRDCLYLAKWLFIGVLEIIENIATGGIRPLNGKNVHCYRIGPDPCGHLFRPNILLFNLLQAVSLGVSSDTGIGELSKIEIMHYHMVYFGLVYWGQEQQPTIITQSACVSK